MSDLTSAMKKLSDNFAHGYVHYLGPHELKIELIDIVIHHKHTFICTGLIYYSRLNTDFDDGETGYGVGHVVVTDDIDIVTTKAKQLITSGFWAPTPKWYIYLDGSIECNVLCDDVQWTIGPP